MEKKDYFPIIAGLIGLAIDLIAIKQFVLSGNGSKPFESTTKIALFAFLVFYAWFISTWYLSLKKFNKRKISESVVWGYDFGYDVGIITFGIGVLAAFCPIILWLETGSDLCFVIYIASFFLIGLSVNHLVPVFHPIIARTIDPNAYKEKVIRKYPKGRKYRCIRYFDNHDGHFFQGDIIVIQEVEDAEKVRYYLADAVSSQYEGRLVARGLRWGDISPTNIDTYFKPIS